ncbi:MAG: hypothetical protein ACRBBR_15095 [Cellvibrionaceae bacterium]
MLEQRRQTYLSLLGIDNYVPRRLLDNAAVSELLKDEHFAFPDILSTGTATNTTTSTAITPPQSDSHLVSDNGTLVQSEGEHGPPAVAVESAAPESTAPINEDAALKQNSPSPLTDILEAKQTSDTPARSEHPTEQAADKISSANQASTAEELNFVLSVWRIRDQLLVIDTRQPGAAYPTDRLLQNMLRAIGHPLAQLPASETIRWPLFINKKFINKPYVSKASKTNANQHQQDVEQARAMVQAYITAQISKMPFKALLCMGDEAARFSLDSDDISTTGENTNQWNIPIIKTPSLFAMLQEPLLKASAWKALQVIIKKDDT